MDIIVILVALLTLVNIEIQKPIKDVDEGYFSQQTCRRLKGLFALVVVLHHLSLEIEDGWITPILKEAGIYAVAVFFFISGYGLIVRLSENKDYLRRFVQKKVRGIIIPYLIISVVYSVARYISGEPYTIIQIIKSFVDGNPVALYSWYLIVCILMYGVFYLAAKATESKGAAAQCRYVITLEFVFCIMWMLLCIYVGYGRWWYVSNFAVVAGMIWAKEERNVLRFLRNNIYTYVFGLSVLVLCFLLLTNCFESEYYPLLSTVIFATIIAMLSMKIRINSPIMELIGKYSFEIYMIHGLFVKLLRSGFVFINNDFIYVLLTVLISIAVAIPLNCIFKMISNYGIVNVTKQK